MKVIKNRQIVEIDWAFSDQINIQNNHIFSYETYEENKEYLFFREGKTGISINGNISIEKLEDNINNFDLIALEFPNFADGRCFSYASILRNTHKFQGDILAFGDILRDQVEHLERSGFNLIKFSENRDINDALNAFSEYTAPYQFAADGQKTILQLR
ncbi:MAG: DUF934 domain-containing protein [Gammaproteobacteria bacterium]